MPKKKYYNRESRDRFDDGYKFNDYAVSLWMKSQSGDNAESLEHLRKALGIAIRDELTPRQQQMLVMAFVDSKSMAEIAAEIGVNRSTVSRTVKRAKDNLRRILRYATPDMLRMLSTPIGSNQPDEEDI